MQKIKNLVHRKSVEAPLAPAQPPVVAAVAPVAEPLNSEVLLAQKEQLHEASLDRNGDGFIDSQERLEGQRLSQGYNSLDRNGDGILDANQGLGLAGNRLSQGVIRAEPTILETIQKDVVVHERIHPVEKEEIQPIIYREREQLDVKQVTQLMHETQIQPTIVEERQLAAEYREAVVERTGPLPENIILPTREVDATTRTQVVHAPIVEEIIKKTVIEEVQPVLERDIYQPVVIQNTQAIHEKIIEAPTVYREITQTRELGTRSAGGDAALLREFGLGPQGQTGLALNQGYDARDRNHDGRVDAQERLAGQRLSQGYTQEQMLLQQQQQALLLQQQQGLAMQQQNVLPTGQVLPNIASSRPAYSYLPPNYSEPRPQFIGTGAEYVRAASGLPQTTFAHAKDLPTINPTALGQAAPQYVGRQ